MLLLVVLGVSGCGGNGENDGRSQTMRLDELGFFEYTDPAKVQQVKKEIDADGASGVFSLDTNRFFFADSEDLAEGGVGDLLVELEPTLRRIGVTPLTVDEDFEEDHYDVTVNGKRYRILAPPDIEDEYIWGYASSRTVMLINDLLGAAQTDERAYGYSGGNDFGIFLLTPRLRDEVAAAIASPVDEPYEVDEQPPNFGLKGA